MPIIKNPKADVRARYRLYLKVSLIISLTLIIAAFKFFPNGNFKSQTVVDTQDLIKIEDVINTIQKPEPPKPPDRPKLIVADIDESPVDVILSNAELDQNAEVGPVRERPVLHKIDDSNEPFFPFPEQLPEPIGGLKSIWEKAHYTDFAIRAGITGTVIIEAAIDKEGNVIDAKVIKGLGGGLNEVSLNAVKQTKFKPGMQHGRPVKVKMTIPIKFILQ